MVMPRQPRGPQPAYKTMTADEIADMRSVTKTAVDYAFKWHPHPADPERIAGVGAVEIVARVAHALGFTTRFPGEMVAIQMRLLQLETAPQTCECPGCTAARAAKEAGE